MFTPDVVQQLGNTLLFAVVLSFFGAVGWLIKKWYTRNEATIDSRAYRWRRESPVLSLVVVLFVGAVVGAAFFAAIWFAVIARQAPSYRLTFHLLKDEKSIKIDEPLQIDFVLVNLTTPHDEVHNVVGQLWIDAEFVTSVTMPPSRGKVGAGRLEWDIRIPVFPQKATFAGPSMLVRMPPRNREILIGAQFVSKETEPTEYMWKIVNENGLPKFITVKNADADLK
jgi:hypothetical protein